LSGTSSSLPGFDVDGIRVWEDATSVGTWYWLPGVPVPLRNADGRRQADVIEAGGRLFVTIGARWTMSAAELEALPRQIAQRIEHADPASLKLVQAPAKVQRVEVVHEYEGTPTVLATGKASGYGSNDVSLALSLEGDQATSFKDALGGNRGHLLVRYHVDVELTCWARAALRGSVPPPKNGERPVDLDATIRGALSSGALEWSRSAAPDASVELRAAAERRAIELAARFLAGVRIESETSPPATSTEVEADALVTEPQTVALIRAADLADWFPHEAPTIQPT
jgi:hypothetical protein